ncbi:MAG: ADP-glyceromanno-heptose 6-epimerase [Bacteroidales bacterium]|nr:ADP-glyceromanno-heptose 6-epimerase [Bacteroidales bacterium]
MIVVTGAAGFIGSNLAATLIERGYTDLVLSDDFSRENKKGNFENKKVKFINRDEFADWLDNNHKQVETIFHLGARTDTTEFDLPLLLKMNTEYTKMLCVKCCKYGIPFIYASSAATYGMGENGFSDTTDPNILKPLNPYGISKNEFDKWLLAQEQKPFFWAGFKFFNVYGPNEYHKGRMASVIMHAFNQINETGMLKLFRSHRPDYADGEQSRDFVYVKDVVDVLIYFMETRKHSGIYNLGTGKARPFNDLGKAAFAAMGLKPNIIYIDTPADIRDKYQYFTEADITSLRKAGYTAEFHSLDDGVKDYVQNYLAGHKYR